MKTKSERESFAGENPKSGFLAHCFFDSSPYEYWRYLPPVSIAGPNIGKGL